MLRLYSIEVLSRAKYQKSEHAADIDRDDTVEIIAVGREIIIHGKLGLNEKLSD